MGKKERMIEPLAITIQEAVHITGENKDQIYNRIEDGEIQAVKSGRKTLIVYASLPKTKNEIADLRKQLAAAEAEHAEASSVAPLTDTRCLQCPESGQTRTDANDPSRTWLHFKMPLPRLPRLLHSARTARRLSTQQSPVEHSD